MPHLKPMDQNSLTRGGGSLTAFMRPSEKIIGDVDVDARHDGRFGRERPLITKMRRNGLRKQYLLHCCEPIARYLVPFYIGAQGAEADEPIAPIFHRNPKERARLFGSAEFLPKPTHSGPQNKNNKTLVDSGLR